MLSNKTRDKIKKHFNKHITQDKIYTDETYEKDFTIKQDTQDFIQDFDKIYDYSKKIVNYRYVGDEKLDMTDITINGQVSIIVYSIDHQLSKPFLFFALEKMDDRLSIPILTVEKDTSVTSLHEGIMKKYKDYTEHIDYQGFYNDNGEIFLFYKSESLQEPRKVTGNEKYYFCTIHEIINIKKVYITDIDEHAIDFFIKNDYFCFLEDEDFNLIETPMVGYTGGYYKRIAIIAALGPIRSNPFASMGPYFYFSSFKRGLRYGVITPDGKPKEINGIKITVGDTPVYEKGGIVKFVMFMGNEKVFLNRDNDPDDSSEISKHVAEKSDIVKATIKNRDNDSNWIKDYDSTIITFKEIDFKGNKRILEPQFTIKNTNQCLPISYYYLNTEKVIENVKIEDEKQIFDTELAELI